MQFNPQSRATWTDRTASSGRFPKFCPTTRRELEWEVGTGLASVRICMGELVKMGKRSRAKVITTML
jgi:hypothetical protein